MRATPSRPWQVVRVATRVLLVSALLLLAFYAIRWQSTLNWLGNYLVCTDRLEHADLIVVMGGDFWGPRVLKGAQLADQGFAPLALISGPPYNGRPEGELAVEFLVQRGYRKDLFAVFPHHEPSTLGEVLVLRGELLRRGVKRVIITTSSYHSRRCAVLFRLFCPGIRFILAPAQDSEFNANAWWNRPHDRDLFESEWTKILGSVLIAYPSYRISDWTRRAKLLTRGAATDLPQQAL